MKNPSCIAWIALLGSGCGTSGTEPCDGTSFGPDSEDCYSAFVIAARDSESIVLSQFEVDQIAAEVTLAKTASCDLTPAAAVSYTGDIYEVVVQNVEDADVAARWSAGEVVTGVVAVDALFAETGAESVSGRSDSGFAIRFARPISVYALAHAAAPLGLRVLTEEVAPHQRDIVRTSNESYLLTIGWGDCLVGCDGTHAFDVSIESGQPEIVAESGDPIPAYVHQQWCTE